MQNTRLSKLKWRPKPVELALLAYLLITLLPAILIVKSNQTAIITLTVHVLLILFISAMSLNPMEGVTSKGWYKIFRLFYPLALLGFLYTETDFLNNLLFKQNLDNFFASVEFFLFGMQPSLEFSIQVPSNVFAEIMYFGYFAYYLMIIGLPLFWYLKRGSAATEKTVFIIIQSFLIFYLFFDIVPVAGPQYYFTNTNSLPQGYLFGFLIRAIQHTGEAPTAAFPSSHVALCLIMIYMVRKESLKIFRWLLPVALLLIFSTVYIRAHYVIDILASFIVAPIVYLLSLSLYEKIKYGL